MEYKIKKINYYKYELIIKKKDIHYNLEKFKEELNVMTKNIKETKNEIIIFGRIKNHLKLSVEIAEKQFKINNKKYCNPFFKESNEQ